MFFVQIEAWPAAPRRVVPTKNRVHGLARHVELAAIWRTETPRPGRGAAPLRRFRTGQQAYWTDQARVAAHLAKVADTDEPACARGWDREVEVDEWASRPQIVAPRLGVEPSSRCAPAEITARTG
jgi:hypothetical protein